jgi:cytochrome c551/c552
VTARLVALAAVAVLLAGCGDSVPGGHVATPTPQTVIGTHIAIPWLGGNAAAGKTVFTTVGCSACHTFTPAHSAGVVGPNLNHLPAYFAEQSGGQGTLPEFIYNSIVDPGSRIVPGYQPGIMPATFGSKLKPAQLADLVAFLSQGH